MQNRENNNISCRKYRKNNREKCSNVLRRWRENNLERYLEHSREYAKKWYEDNKEKKSKYGEIYRKTENGKASNQRRHTARRVREKNIINTLTAEEWIDILKEYKFRCAYCGKEFDLFNKPTRDHIIPISKDGDNTKENIVPACQSCNSKKHNKIIVGELIESQS